MLRESNATNREAGSSAKNRSNLQMEHQAACMASRALKLDQKNGAKTKPDVREIDESKIRERAYGLWLARGCPVGSDQEDWFKAEEELKAT